MTRSSQLLRNASIALIFVFLFQACAPVDAPTSLPTAQEIESPAVSISTPTATIEIIVPTKTESPLSTATPSPSVKINAVKGNLFIRRGANMAFNPIGVLYKDSSAKVIGRDVLSNWVQIKMPDSDKTGWVSIQTKYSQIEGNLQDLPEIMPTEWPQPAYLRNCTHHRMYVMPLEVVIPTSYEYPENEIWIYPGVYTVYDIDVSGDPQVAEISVREGLELEINTDGSGEKRECP